MMQDTSVADDRRQTPAMDDVTVPTLVDLVQLREQTIELLARLERQPQNLRVQAGELTVDITWPDQPPVPGKPVPARGDDVTPPEEAGDDVGTDYLRSPAVGTFYHAREPGAEPFVSVGSIVRPGQQIGVIEAMKLMMPVEADRAGRTTAVVKGNGESTEYDEPLFALEAEEA
jgi:acetyl-CoA carboxylase biotin carboxyl carrier protein